MPTGDSRTIKSAHRVLEILEYFDQNHNHVTVMDMARSLSYPQSSTSELLRCLTRLGYLHYNRHRRTYSPTARVALLGSWVKPSLFRGGALLSAIDDLANEFGETVVVSSACNYVVQHVHAVHGKADDAVRVRIGDTISLLHTAQGKLLLSSYSNELVRSAVHRLNANEIDISRRVRMTEFLQELDHLRKIGWSISHNDDGTSVVAVLLPPMRGMDRIAVGIVAPTARMQERERDLVSAALNIRNELTLRCEDHAQDRNSSNIVPIQPEFKILSYRRHYA